MTNRTPLSRKLRKEAMTTAAPPEKMTNAELPDRDRAMKDAAAIIKQRLKGVTIDFQNLARAFFAYASYASEDKEAARRLAPRVGDVVTIERDDVKALSQVIEEWAAANYQSDDETALGLMKKLIAAGFVTPRALSAPPAASADAPPLMPGDPGYKGWFCERCKVEVKEGRCVHCGKARRERA